MKHPTPWRVVATDTVSIVDAEGATVFTVPKANAGAIDGANEVCSIINEAAAKRGKTCANCKHCQKHYCDWLDALTSLNSTCSTWEAK